MKKNYLSLKKGSALLSAAFLLLVSGAFGQAITTMTFGYTGAVQMYTVPALCVNQITIEVWGAEGGGSGLSGNASSGLGGKGGYSYGVLSVSPGNQLGIYVGGFGQSSISGLAPGGFNGGGSGYASSAGEPGNGGGGATDIRLNGQALANRVIVAGGGGGGGEDTGDSYGHGGGTSGVGYAGYDATQLAAGPNGALGLGSSTNLGDGGGGGGGYYGGGGQVSASIGGDCQGGGGGSGYVGGVSNGLTIDGLNTMPNPSGGTTVGRSGDGFVRIRFVGGNAIAVSASPTVICNGGSAVLTASGVNSYTWSNGSNNTSISVSPVANTTYTVAGTDNAGCTSSLAISIPVDQTVPSLTVAPLSTSVCAGKTVTFTASGATTYTWTGPVPVTNGVAFVPPSTAVYTVTGGNACGTTTASSSVTVNPLPNIGGAANNPTVCGGSQVTLNGTGSAGGYNWTGGVNDNQAFTPPVGINSYTVTGSGANTCTNTAVVTVTVYQTPVVTPVVTPTAICVGKTATLSASGAVNGYTWSVGPAGPNTVAVSPVVTTTYSVIRATGACTSIATVTVVVNPLPNLLVGAPNPPTICAGTCATVTGQGAITYTWYPGGFQGGVITVCPNTSTAYTVVASNANCTTSATSSVTVLPNPVLTVNSSTSTVCAGSPVTLTVTGASTYTWGSPIPVPQQNQNIVTDNPAIPTQYNVSGTDANGCTTSINHVVLTQAAPNLVTAIVNTGSFICAGGIATLTAFGQSPVNYTWLPSGGSANTATVSPSVSTVYTVTGTNPGNGCTSVATLSLAVYISTFAVTAPTAICRGNTTTLSVAGAANNYTWTAGSPNNNDSIVVSPQNTITYYVTGITGSCSTTQSVNLIVHPIPPVTGLAQKITICRFEPAVLQGSGATNYTWTGGAGATTQNYTVFPQITTTYTLTGTDVNGCSKTVQVTQLVATCIGIEEQNNLENQLSIFPNPNTGVFTIQVGTDVNISIINELGQTVKIFSLNTTENQVNISSLAKGIYFIRAEKDGNSIAKKVIVE